MAWAAMLDWISRASSRALRPWRAVTRGGLRVRTESRKDSIGDANHQQILARVVDGDILARLKEAQLADALGGDARGGEVGHAAGFEFDAHVGDVHLGRENRQADGAHLAHRRIGEGEHDVEIVDHQVEHHVHIERAGVKTESRCASKNMGRRSCGSTASTAGLKRSRWPGCRMRLAFRGARGRSGRRLRRGLRPGLFDQQVEARIEQREATA
jgi:hypothetical protein